MTKLSHNAAVIFSYLFPQMNDYGSAIPSIETICKKCGLTRDEVNVAIIELVQNKYITSKVEPTKHPFEDDRVVNWTHYRLPSCQTL